MHIIQIKVGFFQHSYFLTYLEAIYPTKPFEHQTHYRTQWSPVLNQEQINTFHLNFIT